MYNSKLPLRDEGVIAALTAGLLLAECAELPQMPAYYIEGKICAKLHNIRCLFLEKLFILHPVPGMTSSQQWDTTGLLIT